MRLSYAHAARSRRVGAEERPAADLAIFAPAAGIDRISRLRRARAQSGRETATGRRSRKESSADSAESRLADGRTFGGGRVPGNVRARSGVPHSDHGAVGRLRTDPGWR